MKFFYLTFAILIVIGCASSSKNDTEKENTFPDLVTLQQPKDQPHQSAKVYIDSVKQVTIDNKPSLLIRGTFPDACTNLDEVTHNIEDDSLFLHLSSWRNPEKMCAQVLTSFSFIYDKLTEEEISNHSQVIINNSSYSY